MWCRVYQYIASILPIVVAFFTLVMIATIDRGRDGCSAGRSTQSRTFATGTLSETDSKCTTVLRTFSHFHAIYRSFPYSCTPCGRVLRRCNRFGIEIERIDRDLLWIYEYIYLIIPGVAQVK